jgi:sodium/bile acid cotransporter 7
MMMHRRCTPQILLLLLLTLASVTCFTTASSPVARRVSTAGDIYAFHPIHHGKDATSLLSSLSGGENQPAKPMPRTKIQAFLEKNFFLMGMVVAVSLARLFPWLGRNGGVLRPELFIGKFGVTFIFLLSGLSLELSELTEALTNYELNSAVQLTTFVAWPYFVGLPLTRTLKRLLPNLLPPTLLDGLLILTCLPTTVNMCIFLTAAAGGNVASALCNAVISNLAGIFVTPALLLRFFGTEVQLPFLSMVWKLCNKVLFPVGEYDHTEIFLDDS